MKKLNYGFRKLIGEITKTFQKKMQLFSCSLPEVEVIITDTGLPDFQVSCLAHFFGAWILILSYGDWHSGSAFASRGG